MTMKTDAQIHRDVTDELKWDVRLRQSVVEVNVAVDAGIVTLRGTVDTWSTRFAAQRAAHRVGGVLDVANDIRVQVATSSHQVDTDVTKAVRKALEWDVLVPDERVHTTVSDGVVTMEGNVEYRSQHDEAARAIRNLPGVRDVDNRIVVRPAVPCPSNSTVREAIKGALERHADHATRRVQVEVSEGRVILTGEVATWAERQAVEGASRGTPGVWGVDNHLVVRAA
jgi:osmotically-inducible protein OsmY